MSLMDTLIIYLACGSPFGVYKMTQRDGGGAAAWVNSLAAFVLWPVFLGAIVLRRFSPPAADVDAVESIRSEIESAAFDDDAGGLFDFREVFYRYTGLAEACTANAGPPPSAALVELAGGWPNDVASECLTRRDRAKLEFHRTMARTEFIETIADLSVAGHARIVDLAMRLSEHLGDDDASSELKAMSCDLAHRSRRVPEAEKWNTKVPSTTTIS